jgi:NAD(P)H-hydrate epimerase
MEEYHFGNETTVMSREQVRGFDNWAINTLGILGVVLMENAGRSCAELIREKLADTRQPKVCIFCGTGNNGGDGYVIGRHLFNYGYSVVVVICGEREKISGDAKVNLDILEGMGLRAEQLQLKDKNISERLGALAADADMIVDGLFGTGLKGRLRSEYISLIEAINSLKKPVLAIDIPSGLDCDTGQVLGSAIRAAYTVTFVAVKAGFTRSEAVSDYTGEIFVASIGIDPHVKEALT